MPEGSRPDPYFDSFTALVGARALTTAVMLGVFDALHEQPATAAELAVRLGLDPLGADTLLTTLMTLGYVEADGDLVRNAPVSEEQLVRCSPNSIATFVGEQADLHWQTLALLPDAVRDGRAYAMHEQRHDDSERWEAYIRGLYEISRPDHDANAALVPVQDPRLLVDVAGGHGAFSMAMCRRHPRLRATVIDLPPAAAVGRRIVQHEGYADRVSFREGDVFEVGLGGPADVISAFNLIHHLPQARNRELCRIAHASLRPGGCLVIGDSARPEPGEQASQHGAISSILFYAWSHSRNFKPSEIRAWMQEARFDDVTVHRNPLSPWRVVVVGRNRHRHARGLYRQGRLEGSRRSRSLYPQMADQSAGDAARPGHLVSPGRPAGIRAGLCVRLSEFSSGVLLGRAANGRTEWKTEDGRPSRSSRSPALRAANPTNAAIAYLPSNPAICEACSFSTTREP